MPKHFITPLIFLLLLLFSIVFNQAIAEETLLWQDCIKEAQKNHPDLISAAESINEKKASKGVTTSGLFPQVDATASASTTKKETNSSTTTTDSYSYGVSASQLIFDGFSTINDMKAASENVEAARQNYRFTSSQIRLNLRTAFVNLLRAQELIKVTKEIIEIRSKSLDLIKLRYQSGLEHKGALLTAEANLAQAKFELSQAKREVELAQRQLTKEMGRKELRPIYATGDFTVTDIAENKPDFEDLVKKHPSVLKAFAEKKAAAFNVKSSYGSFMPQVTGTASGDKADSHWSPRNDQYSLGVSLSMPIFDGGLLVSEASKAKALYRKAEEDERSTRDAAIVNLEQTWIDLKDSIETVGVQRKSLEAAEERSKIAEAQYSTGFVSFDNWIIIQNDLVLAKKTYLQAQTNALFSEASWIQAKGETLEYAQ